MRRRGLDRGEMVEITIFAATNQSARPHTCSQDSRRRRDALTVRWLPAPAPDTTLWMLSCEVSKRHIMSMRLYDTLENLCAASKSL